MDATPVLSPVGDPALLRSRHCSINNDHRFLVSRDGEVLASFTDFLASEAKGADPAVLATALAEMGIDDIEAFDDDNENYLDDLELLCRVAGVRPGVDDVTGRGRVAILRRLDVHRRVRFQGADDGLKCPLSTGHLDPVRDSWWIFSQVSGLTFPRWLCRRRGL
jgi:hypothetical protein